ncbi:MAG: amidohydrolase family protein, partial [Spirochaetaceae bacterium]|nr:amidohydrolase family protein [Spirochaetaceae bacterium]
KDDFVIAHGLTINDRDIEILAERGVGVAHCPQAYGKVGGWPWPQVDTWMEKGIAVGFGTDGPASNNDLDMFEELRFGAMVRKLQARDGRVLPARQLIRMATLGGARVLGLASDIGSIETGKKADIILLDFRKPHLRPLHNIPGHLAYCAKAADVETVMVDGRFLYRDGGFLTLDINSVVTEADSEFRALLERAKWTPTLEEPKAGVAASLRLSVTQQSLKIMEVLIGAREADDEMTL